MRAHVSLHSMHCIDGVRRRHLAMMMMMMLRRRDAVAVVEALESLRAAAQLSPQRGNRAAEREENERCNESERAEQPNEQFRLRGGQFASDKSAQLDAVCAGLRAAVTDAIGIARGHDDWERLRGRFPSWEDCSSGLHEFALLFPL